MSQSKAQAPIPYSDQVINDTKHCGQTWLNFFQGLQPKEWGTATLASGEIVVNSKLVAGSSQIMATRATAGASPGHLYADPADIVPGTSFKISSTDAGDNGVVNWILLN